jgi:hypothetical protein
MATGDCYALQLEALCDDNFVQNTLHFSLTDVAELDPLTTAKGLALAFQTTLQAAWLNCFAADYSLLGYSCKRIFDGGGPTYNLATPTVVGSVTGMSDASLMGGMLQGLYVDPITFKYRQVRITMPGAPSAYIEGSQLSADYIAALALVAGLLGSTLTGADTNVWQFCGFKRKNEAHAAMVLSLIDVRYSLHIGIQRKRARPQL